MSMHRLLRACAVALLLLACMPACAAREKRPEPAEAILLPMTDGVRLATDVYHPGGAGPWPVVLLRSTYSRAVGPAKELMDEGYAVVVQDVRGMGTSEGEKYVFRADGWRPGLSDGADTVAWIEAQPWCNGKIGTMGGSALGLTQVFLAPATNGLSAQAIDVAPIGLYGHCTYVGGVFLKNMIEGWLTGIGQPHLIPVYKGEPRYGEFWSWYDSGPKTGDIAAPALFTGGWYDIFAQGTIDAFNAREQSGGDGARGKNVLVMRWSSHGPDTSPDYKFNPNRTEDLRISHLTRDFFKFHLQGDATALDRWAKVHYYVMGDDAPGAPGSEWRTADAWPPYPTVATPHYLRADRTLDTGATDAAAGSLGYAFDPKDPYPTHGGNNLLLPSGPYDQRVHSAVRKDFLAFAAPPLKAPVEIAGKVTATLYVSSDAPDTDFTAKLIDIFPDGRELNVVEGIRRVKTREGFDRIAPPLTSGQTIALEIDLWSTAWIFNTGHRIALHVSSSNYPRFEVNPNTGEDFPGPPDTMRTANNTVHTGPETPSAVVLPVRAAQ